MRALIATGSKDAASKNILTSLLNNFEFSPQEINLPGFTIYKLKDFDIFLTQTPELIDEDSGSGELLLAGLAPLDILVMGAWHMGASPPLLCVHTGGNPGEENPSLAFAPAAHMKFAVKRLEALNLQSGLNWLTCMEATHGPPIQFTTPFITFEIGSTENDWANPTAGEITAKAIVDTLISEITPTSSVIAVGGSQYSGAVRKLLLDTEYAVGHFFSHSVSEHLGINVLKQGIDKTIGKVTALAINKKENSETKTKFKQFAAELALETIILK
jgi:D-tyrosyl-tRNA(Tyr) deacylase